MDWDDLDDLYDYDDADDDDWSWDDWSDDEDDDDDDDDDDTPLTTYVTNDGVTVTVVGEGNHQVWLSSGAYGTAQNINANPSWGQNVLVGNYAANLIVSGAGQNNLWGGQDYANDILVGGAGYDTFICGKNEGSDVVTNAAAADTVSLYDVTLSDIAFTASDGRGTVALQFKSGNILSVQSSELLSSAFVLADGSAYRYNHATRSWQGA